MNAVLAVQTVNRSVRTQTDRISVRAVEASHWI